VFHSNSDDEHQFDNDDKHDDDFDSPPHKHDYYNDSQPHHQFYMNFAKNKPHPPSSIVYKHRPINNQTVYVGETSTRDFLNFFENNDKYYPQMMQYILTTTPRRDSKDMREEEGILDLEDEDEFVKQVH